MGAGTTDDRDQPLDQLVRRVDERRRAVSSGAFELQLKASIIQLGESIGGDRRASEIAGHSFQITGHGTVAMTGHYSHVDAREKLAAASKVLLLAPANEVGIRGPHLLPPNPKLL